MHFATLIPDWNSLDSVRHAHSDLEAAALVFFALLVLFDILAHLSTDDKRKTLLEKIGLCCFAIAVLAEVVAYPYGQRNDTLSEQVIGSLDAKSREAATNASSALTKSSEAETKTDAADKAAGKAQGKADAAAKRADAANEQAGLVEKRAEHIGWYLRVVSSQLDWRELDVKKFAASLQGKPKGSAEFWYVPDDIEAEAFAGELYGALGKEGAGWDVSPPQPLSLPTDSDLKWSKTQTLLNELRLSAATGLSAAYQKLDWNDPGNIFAEFERALAGSISTKFFSIQGTEVPTLPSDHIVIVVGRHRPRVLPFKMEQSKP